MLNSFSMGLFRWSLDLWGVLAGAAVVCKTGMSRVLFPTQRNALRRDGHRTLRGISTPLHRYSC
jgi:hypothetical protein